MELNNKILKKKKILKQKQRLNEINKAQKSTTTNALKLDNRHINYNNSCLSSKLLSQNDFSYNNQNILYNSEEFINFQDLSKTDSFDIQKAKSCDIKYNNELVRSSTFQTNDLISNLNQTNIYLETILPCLNNAEYSNVNFCINETNYDYYTI